MKRSILFEIFQKAAKVLAILLFIQQHSSAQIVIIDTLTDTELAQALAGQGVAISNVTSQCNPIARSYFNGVNSNIGLSEGILLTSGYAINAVGPNDEAGVTGDNLDPGDPDIDAAINGVSYDACILEFDIQVLSDSISFRYVFGSDEYTEYVNSQYNDAFAFFISGPGITGTVDLALVPGTSIPVAINNVNNGTLNTGPCMNCAYYIDNGDGSTFPTNTDPTVTQYDGFTTVLTAGTGGLTPCATYHLKLVIADVGDYVLDSGVFLEAKSISSTNISIEASTSAGPGFDNAVENCNVEAMFTFILDDVVNLPYQIDYQIGGTATNGTDYALVADSIIVPAGSDSAVLTISPLADGLTEPLESVVIYLVNQCNGTLYDSAVVYIQDDMQFEVTSVGDTICKFNSIQLNSSGAATYSWSPPNDLDDPFAPNPVASPLNSTLYQVDGMLGTCTASDSVWVHVFDELLLVDAGPDDSICLNASSQLEATVSGNLGPVSWEWTPSAGLDDSAVSNPLSIPDATTQYVVQVTSSIGCKRADSVNIVVTGTAPTLAIHANLEDVCTNDTITIYSEISAGLCESTPLQCSGALTTATIGSGTQVSVNPTPFKGFWHDSRIQMLYTATELNAAGIGPAKVSEIAFNITNKGSTIPYSDFTVRMGCTGESYLDTLIADLDLVFNPKPVTTSLGLNSFQLDQAYNWDGVSNLVIEICYDNVQYTGNDEVSATATAFNSVLQSFTDNDAGCNLSFAPFYAVRPDLVLSVCSQNPPPTTFTWNPTANLVVATLDSAIVLLNGQTTYTLDIIQGACQNSASLTLTDDSSYSVVATADTAVCLGNVAQLGAAIHGIDNSSITFTWVPATGLDDPNGQNPVATPIVSTLYTVYATLGDCMAYDSVWVHVINEVLTVDAGPDDSICLNADAAINLSVSGNISPVSFDWSPGFGLNDSTIQSPVSSPNGTTTYEVFVSSANGCFARDSITIIVTGIAPVVDLFTTAQPQCGGDTITIYSELNAGSCSTTSFSCGSSASAGTVGTGSAGSNFPTPYKGYWHDSRLQLLYQASELNAAGVSASNITELSFNVTSKFSSLPYSGFTIKMGCTNQMQLTTMIQGLDVVLNPTTYSSMQGINTHILDNPYTWDGVSNVVIEICFDNMQYTSNDAVASTATAFTSALQEYTDFDVGCNLNSFPNAYSMRPNITFAFCPQNLANIGYSWSPASNVLASTLDSAVVVLNGPTTFTMDIQDGACVNSASISVSSDSAFTITTLPDTAICVAAPIQLTTQLEGAIPSSISYTWSPPTGLSDPSVPNPLLNPVQTVATYIVEATSGSGCVARDTFNITFGNAYVLDAGPDTNLCSVDSVRLSAEILGQSSQNFSFSWEPAAEVSDPSIPDPIAVPTGFGSTYIVQSTSTEGCINLDTVVVSIESAFDVFAGNDTVFCANENVQLNALISGQPPTGFTYQWTPSSGLNDPTVQNPMVLPGAGSTEYAVIVTSPSGCTARDTIVVLVDVPFILDAGDDETLCDPVHTQLQATISGVNPFDFTYQWSNSQELNDPAITNPIALPTPPSSMYVITATSPAGCSMNDTVFVLIDTVFSVDVGPDIYTCATTDAIPLFVDVIGRDPGQLSFMWVPDGDLNNANIQDPFYYPTMPNSTLQVMVMSPAGCMESDEISIVLAEPFTLEILFTDTTIIVGDQITIGAMVSGGSGNFDFWWSPPNGVSNATTLMTDASPSEDQVYLLTVTDNGLGKCSDTTSVLVRVIERIGEPEDSIIVIPSAFTPNGDQLNETFFPLTSGPVKGVIEFRIYNRWGNLIHNGPYPWDGTYKGEEQPIGAYVYIAEIEMTSNERKMFTGNVSLLR